MAQNAACIFGVNLNPFLEQITGSWSGDNKDNWGSGSTTEVKGKSLTVLRAEVDSSLEISESDISLRRASVLAIIEGRGKETSEEESHGSRAVKLTDDGPREKD